MEHVEYINDYFVDFEGKTHHFVLAAVSVPYEPSEDEQAALEDYYLDLPIYAKGLKLGLAICNPTDQFDIEIGKKKALARAKHAPEYALVANKSGYINTPMVAAFLQQEANYIKLNPENYIKGYSERKERFNRKAQMDNMYNNMSELEKDVISILISNPKYLDNVIEYAKWKRNGIE